MLRAWRTLLELFIREASLETLQRVKVESLEQGVPELAVLVDLELQVRKAEAQRRAHRRSSEPPTSS